MIQKDIEDGIFGEEHRNKLITATDTGVRFVIDEFGNVYNFDYLIEKIDDK